MAALSSQLSGDTVLITFDPHPRTLLDPNNSPRLLSPLSEKLALLEQYDVQNVVVVKFDAQFANQSANDYINRFLIPHFLPMHIIIGYDHRYGKNREGGLELLLEKSRDGGFVVEEIPKQLVDDIEVSSTKIRKALAEGNIDTANQLLGYSYTLEGVVKKGRQIGRSIGFPTANIALHSSDKLLPANGVYAIMAGHGNQICKGMLNIGIRPTFEEQVQLSIEANLFNFESDIYEEPISVELIKYLRSEKKFENIEALRQQLEQDKIASLYALSNV